MTIKEKSYEWAYPLTPRSQTTHLILHHAAGDGTPEAIHAFHLSKGWAGIAYHYYVRKSGEIVRGRPENVRGGHTKDWNYCAIGICFEGNFDAENMEDAQLSAGRELIANIKARYPGIEIGKHGDYNPTGCPGKLFPFNKLLEGEIEPPALDAEDTGLPDAWAVEACDWAVENGIFKGDGSSFRWKDSVTRQELAVVLRRMHQLKQ